MKAELDFQLKKKKTNLTQNVAIASATQKAY